MYEDGVRIPVGGNNRKRSVSKRYTAEDLPDEAENNPFWFDQADAHEVLGMTTTEAQERLGLSEDQFDQVCREVEEMDTAVRRRNSLMEDHETTGFNVRVGRMRGRSIDIARTPRSQRAAPAEKKRVFGGVSL